ncbi:MAG TPA: hypothetical protein VNW97_16150 [Candidatus Saccharimonadales bacterium]|nr:hypothetical protein [Candidatus Saccharimonadales bacterium]
MQASDIYYILKQAGATHLHHAHSVITSCTFLEHGGVLSRGFAEDHGLKQSSQPSDQLDKKYDIWHRIFLPHADIHDRGGQEKGPNPYGPVLFVFDLDVLLRLPAGAECRMTKKSPTYWYDPEPESDRWFQSAEDLGQNIRYGDFGQILALQTPSGKFDFPDRRARVILDDPQRQMSAGESAYLHARNRLKAAATVGRVELSIERRRCQTSCICLAKYATWSVPVMDFYFG